MSAEAADEGIREPFLFGPSTLAIGDPAVYCPGGGWAQQAEVTDRAEGRMYYMVRTPTGDVGSGCWHSELHSPEEFLARAASGELGPTVQAAAAAGGGVAEIVARLEPATREPDRDDS